MKNLLFLGETFKVIREAKGYTQEYVSDLVMNRTTYSKIENDKMTPTIHMFNRLLERLDVTYEEFFFIKENYNLNEKMKIIKDFRDISYYSEGKDIMNLKERCLNILSHNKDETVENIHCSLNIILSLHNKNYNQAFRYSEELWNKIKKMDIWFITELHLILQVLLYLPVDNAIQVGNQALESVRRYSSFTNTKDLEALYLIHLNTIIEFHGLSNQRTLVKWENILKHCRQEKLYDKLAISYIRYSISLRLMGEKQKSKFFLKKGEEKLKLLSLEYITSRIENEFTLGFFSQQESEPEHSS